MIVLKLWPLYASLAIMGAAEIGGARLGAGAAARATFAPARKNCGDLTRHRAA